MKQKLILLLIVSFDYQLMGYNYYIFYYMIYFFEILTTYYYLMMVVNFNYNIVKFYILIKNKFYGISLGYYFDIFLSEEQYKII